jgi:hypothetical protein
MYLYGSIEKNIELIDLEASPYTRFEYGIKSDTTKQKYVKRLELFFDFYRIEGGTVEQNTENFLNHSDPYNSKLINLLRIQYNI